MARELYREVRATVRSEYELGEQKASLSRSEMAHLQPALSNVMTALQASPGDPVGPELFGAVVKAHQAISDELTALTRRIDHAGLA